MFQYFFSKEYNKELLKLEKNIFNLIQLKLKTFQEAENPLFYAKKLQGVENTYRIRIQNYRVLFYLEENKIIFLSVKHRKDIYK